jgi:hypothetical protein
MFADYFIIRRTRLRLSHLYVPDQSSIYWYTHGLSSFLALPRPGAEVYRASSYMAPLFFFFCQVSISEPLSSGCSRSSLLCLDSPTRSARASSTSRSAGFMRVILLGCSVRNSRHPYSSSLAESSFSALCLSPSFLPASFRLLHRLYALDAHQQVVPPSWARRG